MITPEALQAAQATLATLETWLRPSAGKTVAIYGASATGVLVRRAATMAGVTVAAWVDGAIERQGHVIDGLQVAAPRALVDLVPDVLVLATTSATAAAAMTAELEALGLGGVPRLAFVAADQPTPAPAAPTGPSAPGLVEPWVDDQRFVSIHQQCAAFTLVDVRRCHWLYQAVQQVASLPGEMAELGVYRGGTAKLLASCRVPATRPLHLLDTFAGMPETDPGRDRHRRGDFADTSEAAVRRLLEGYPEVHLHPGTFPATAGALADRRFAFVHVDADIHRSVHDACAFFYPRLVPGGLMIFDDYGFPSCPGAKAAVDGFFDALPEQPLYLQTGQALICRLP